MKLSCTENCWLNCSAFTRLVVVVVIVIVVIVIFVTISGISCARNQAPHHKDLCSPGTQRQTYEHPLSSSWVTGRAHCYRRGAAGVATIIAMIMMDMTNDCLIARAPTHTNEHISSHNVVRRTCCYRVTNLWFIVGKEVSRLGLSELCNTAECNCPILNYINSHFRCIRNHRK